jgi:chemotaxis signal transduction protein
LIDETGTTGMVLGEISSAGSKTKDIFEDSIKNLNETVISSFLADVEFSARLAIDIMDRNLYERANDCRWWALASDFRKILAKDKIDDSDKQKLEDILSYINNLYTVYTNLFIYDKYGEILAISMPKGERLNEPIKFLDKNKWISKTIKQKWIDNTMKIIDSQQYTVSAFAPTDLYEEGQHTYIYNASIRDIDEPNKSIGGIGIIFDSTPQFFAMLDDSLPKNENNETKDGAIGFFVQKDKTIISSTEKSFQIGSKLDIDDKFFNLNNGESASDIICFNDYNYAVGASCSTGYREYKSDQDSYKNDVISIILNPIGKTEQENIEQQYKKPEKLTLHIPQDISSNAPNTKIITFYLDGHWFGLLAKDCECTVGLEGLTPVLAKEKNFVYGFKTYKNETVYVINMTHDLQPSMEDVHSDSDIIIAKIDGNPYIKYIGILTEQIGEIKNFPDSMIDSLKSIMTNTDLFSTAIIRNPEDEKSEMVTLIDQNKIARRLIDPEKR